VPAGRRPGELPTVGKPVPHAQIHIVDGDLREVAAGEPGELVIGGPGVARGYRRRPELTEEKFIPDPWQPGGRLYRTGDLGRYLPDGEIAFLGRADNQVKIRGFRVELEEIAAALNAHPAVRASCVVAREEVPGDARLVAYIVVNESRPTRSELVEFLAAELPRFMVPATFVVLDALPCTDHGKVDRSALPEPGAANVLNDGQVAPPVSPTQQTLCATVCALLRISEVGLDDNFFLLGGHSLLGTQLIARIADAFKIKLALRTLFERPTIRELAAAVDEALAKTASSQPQQ
jgi:acyl carrier protein